jgi:hypothetical protein
MPRETGRRAEWPSAVLLYLWLWFEFSQTHQAFNFPLKWSNQMD